MKETTFPSGFRRALGEIKVTATSVDDSVELLYRDPHLVAVRKPAGMLMHRSRLAAGVSDHLLQQTRDLIGQYVFPVQRLDRGTSGLVVFGLSSEVARGLSEQFSRREVSKTYLAVVRGLCEETGVVDSPLQERLDRLADAQASHDKLAQEARTVWHCRHRIELPVPVGRYATARYSVLEVHPETGRKHQIRRHLRRVSRPIIGDRQYGDRDHNRYFAEMVDCRRMLLAAWRLEFTHPVDGRRMSLCCPLRGSFVAALRHLCCPDSLLAEWQMPFVNQEPIRSVIP